MAKKRFRYERCKRCESRKHPRVYNCVDPPMQVRRIRICSKVLADETGWEGLFLAARGRNEVVKVGVTILGRATRDEVVRAVAAAARELRHR